MSLLEPWALALLLSLAVLAWLVFMQRGSRRVEVGTLFIWRKVAARPDARRRKARVEPLFWLCAGALVVAAVSAARPALIRADGAASVAVFIERLAGEGPEPDAAEVFERARAAAPSAQLRFFATAPTGLAAMDDSLTLLAPGAISEELAQFRARSREADAHLLFLCEPVESAPGLTLPRVLSLREGVLFALEVRGKRVFARSSGYEPPKVTGAALVAARTTNGETLREYEAAAEVVEISAPHSPTIKLDAVPPVNLKTGGRWNTDAHRALTAALVASGACREAEPAGVGLDAEAPARVELWRGKETALGGAHTSFDARHPLFSQLPMSAFDWTGDHRVLDPAPGETVLLAATRDGAVVGALITLSADGKTLRFAGDPFSRAPVAAAALLLDNALGTLTGERPSEAARYRVAGGRLPSERAAFAAPFDPTGSLDVSSAGPGALSEWTSWLALAGALLALGAAWLVR